MLTGLSKPSIIPSVTSKERMLCALKKGKPDRLPASVHQWQKYHLDTYLGGTSDLEAFERFGLDAAVQSFQDMGQFWLTDADFTKFSTPDWRDEVEAPPQAGTRKLPSEWRLSPFVSLRWTRISSGWQDETASARRCQGVCALVWTECSPGHLRGANHSRFEFPIL